MLPDGRWRIPPTTSASQLQTYAMCPRKYAASYVLGLVPEFRSQALVLGSAMHSAIGWWFGEKLGGRAPGIPAAEEVLVADLAAGAAGTKMRWKASSLEGMEEEARRLLRLYLTEHGQQPVASVEQPFQVDFWNDDTGEVLGRQLKGYFDLVREDGTVVELKTSSRGYDESDLARHLQVGAYAFACNSLHGGPSKLEVHVLVKLKREPRVETYRIERGEADLAWWQGAAHAIEDAIAARQFPPSPSPFCRECEFGRSCLAWASSASEARSTGSDADLSRVEAFFAM